MDLKYEEILQDGPIPLDLLTLQQSLGNLEILRLHTELNIVLHLIAFFNIKSTKPKNLFDGMANQSFFCEINKKLPYVLPKSDLILDNIRFKFLCKIVTASVDLIRECFNQVYLEEHIQWIKKVEHLTIMWNLNLDDLKRHQVIFSLSLLVIYCQLIIFLSLYRLLSFIHMVGIVTAKIF